MEILKERLIGRGTEDLETIEKRLRIAEAEMKQVDFYDYVIVNDDLDKAIGDVKRVILKNKKH